MLASPSTSEDLVKPVGAERRRYPRLVFAPMDGVTAGLEFAAPNGPPMAVQAMVMNLSRGGLGMGIPRDEMGGLQLAEGDFFRVAELRIAYRQVNLSLDTEAEIRWYLDADYLNHVCFGCAFHPTGEKLTEKLRGFIESHFSHLTLA